MEMKTEMSGQNLGLGGRFGVRYLLLALGMTNSLSSGSNLGSFCKRQGLTPAVGSFCKRQGLTQALQLSSQAKPNPGSIEWTKEDLRTQAPESSPWELMSVYRK